MRRPWLVAVLLLGAGCQCGNNRLRQAVRVDLTYDGFHPGCLKLHVADAADPSRSVDRILEVPAGTSSTLTVAVYRQDSWGARLTIRASADEQSCSGAEVAIDSKEVELQEGQIVPAALHLTATDLDQDGFVPKAQGGTDCDDERADVHPGAPELCDGVDNDCNGSADEGYELGVTCQATPCLMQWKCAADGGRDCSIDNVLWYPDQDLDGHGRSDGGGTSGCNLADAGRAPNADDCDDSDRTVYAGAPELCDGKDNNCNGQVDEGHGVGGACTAQGCPGAVACASDGGTRCDVPATRTVYRDLDLDLHGSMDAGAFQLCGLYGLDAGQADVADDCDDSRADVHPGAPELCDLADNDCNGQIDEGWNVGAACDGGAGTCPGAVIACAADGGSTCNASGPVQAYVDDDLDNYGRPDSGTLACVFPGSGYSTNATDCDDGNPYVHPGAPEICDHRDNNCNGIIDDPGACPSNPAWTSRTVGGGAQDWETVSPWEDGGSGVWIAGLANVLRVEKPTAAVGTFTNDDTDCTGTWNGSWADPVTGRVYLVGPSFRAAAHDVESGSCIETDAGRLLGEPRGLVGFRTDAGVLMYAVGVDGGSFVWDGGQGAAALPNVSACLEDVHGLGPELMFAVGGQTCAYNSSPRIYRFDAVSSAWQQEDLSASGAPSNMELHAVHVVNPRLAYAVGGDGFGNTALLVWDGSAWTAQTPPSGAVFSTGVVAFGRSAVFIADFTNIYEFDGGSWGRVYNPGGSNYLRDLAGNAPDDLWGAGINGVVVHWPQ